MNYLLLHCALSIFRMVCVPGVNGRLIKKTPVSALLVG